MKNDPRTMSQCRKREGCACVKQQQPVPLFQMASPSRNKTPCFQGDHNFSTCDNANFKNKTAQEELQHSFHIDLMGCYTLQLEAMNLKGNIEDLPKSSANETVTFIFYSPTEDPTTVCTEEILYHTFITATGHVFSPISASSICK